MLDETPHNDLDPAAAPEPAHPSAIEGPGAPLPSAPAAPDFGRAASPDEGAQPPAPPSAQPPTPGQPPHGGAPTGAAEPWAFRADRQEYFVEGSRVEPDGGVYIPKAQLQLVQQLLAEGAAHRGSWREERDAYEARIAELEASVEQHPDLLRARAFNTKLNQLMAAGPEAVAEWLDKFETNRPVLEAEVKAQLLQSQLDQTQSRERAAQEEAESNELAPVMEETLQGAVEELASRYPGVDPGKFYTRMLERYADRVFYEVPASDRRRGLHEGEVVLGQSRDNKTLYVMDRGLVEDEFANWAGLMGASATSATRAVTQNAAALAAGAPPVATGSGGAAQGAPVPPMPKTKEELDKWMQSGEWKKNFPMPTVP